MTPLEYLPPNISSPKSDQEENKVIVNNEEAKSVTSLSPEPKTVKKKKLPWESIDLIDLPFFGIDYPMIDGEGVSSMGREGIGLRKFPYL